MKNFRRFILFLSLLAVSATKGGNIDSCRMEFTPIGDFCLHVRCAIDTRRDSLQLNFGGPDSLSVSDLRIRCENLSDYRFDIPNKKLTLRMKEAKACRIEMEYDYLNISSAFISGQNGAEMWEPSQGEWYYPFVYGEKYPFRLTFRVPRKTEVVGGYPLEKRGHRYAYASSVPLASNSMVFVLFDKRQYERSEFRSEGYGVECIHRRGCEFPTARKTELPALTRAAIEWFSSVLGPYEDRENGIVEKPLYLLHEGNGHSNRNNVNYISASRQKFSGKPHILPIVHEIGHRWLGEWTLMIEDGRPGAYFIKESLNEYMTLLFAKHHYGPEYFQRLYREAYLRAYEESKGSANDVPLIRTEWNTNWTVVYCKGPVILHSVVEKWGEDNWLRFIGDFYDRYKYAPNLSYELFIEALAEKDTHCASELDRLVRGTTEPQIVSQESAP